MCFFETTIRSCFSIRNYFFDLKIIVRYEHENIMNDLGTTPHSKQKIKSKLFANFLDYILMIFAFLNDKLLTSYLIKAIYSPFHDKSCECTINHQQCNIRFLLDVLVLLR